MKIIRLFKGSDYLEQRLKEQFKSHKKILKINEPQSRYQPVCAPAHVTRDTGHNARHATGAT